MHLSLTYELIIKYLRMAVDIIAVWAVINFLIRIVRNNQNIDLRGSDVYKSRKRNKTLSLQMHKKLKEQGVIVETGVFGADMKVSITNDGPITIILESGV